MNEHIHIILGAMLFKDSPWSSEPRQQSGKQRYTWRKSLYRHLLKHGYRPMWEYSCIWMNIEKMCTPPRLIVEQCCTWRTISYCHHLKHGYRQMLSHNCIEWMSERHPPRRLTMRQFGLKPNVHFIAWVWVIKASLIRPWHFFSQSD